MMKPFSPRTLIFFSSHASHVPLHATHSPSTSSSTHSLSFSSSSSFSDHRRYDEEAKNVRVSVWWDFENCSLVAGTNVFKVAHRIMEALRANGIRGPVQISAYGDVVQLSRANQEALSSTGISLVHIPNDGKNSADRSLLVDLMYWVSQNPPPAHLFLISSDRDFAGTLHRLRMNNYNILLATKDSAHSVLCSAASVMWYWNTLVKGENLCGKHFNRPPDGPHGSWYGHYKAPLENPFSATEPEVLSDTGSDSVGRPIPKAVMMQIRHVLKSHPNGISITELRQELRKSTVNLDKDLYGYKKFTRFLFAMPHILKLQHIDDGNFMVHSVGSTPEPVERNRNTPGPLSPTHNSSLSPNLNDEDMSINVKSPLAQPSKNIHETAIIPDSGDQDSSFTPKRNGEDMSLHTKSSPSRPSGMNFKNSPTKELCGISVDTETTYSALVVDFFQKLKRMLFSTDGGISGRKCDNSPTEGACPRNSNEKAESEVRGVEATSFSAGPIEEDLSYFPSQESAPLDKTEKISENGGVKLGSTPALFQKIIGWCKFWKEGLNTETSCDQSSEGLSEINSGIGRHGVFSKESFWDDMRSFVNSPKGSIVVCQAKSRKEMAHNMQNEGPVFLRSLDEEDLLQLVDLLISEKKLVEECPSDIFPFKLPHEMEESCSGESGGSNGSSCANDSDSKSKLDMQKFPEDVVEGRSGNRARSVASGSSFLDDKSSQRSRVEILTDCQNLVDELFKQHPEGFDIGLYKTRFFERYGYSFDVRKLGYRKMASLLEIMPGVKIESRWAVPRGHGSKSSNQESALAKMEESDNGTVTNSDSDPEKVEYNESAWEELGPVAEGTSGRNFVGSGSEENARPADPGYESGLSDDAVSDSEEGIRSRGGGKEKLVGTKQESSPLLQILDIWYSRNKDNGRASINGVVDEVREHSVPLDHVVDKVVGDDSVLFDHVLDKVGDDSVPLDRVVEEIREDSEPVDRVAEEIREDAEPVDRVADFSWNVAKPPGSVGIKSETSVVDTLLKRRPRKSFTFVAESVDDKDRLIDGILGSLKKSVDPGTRS